jgi:hypothetical protein
MGDWRHSSSILGLGTRRQVSRHDRFTPREIAQDIHCIGGLLGPRADMEVAEKVKSLAPLGNRTPTVQSFASLTATSRIIIIIIIIIKIK